MLASTHQRLAVSLLFAVALAASSTGCSLMSRGNVNSRPLEPGELADFQQRAVEEETVNPNEQTIKVSIKGQFSRKKTIELPLEHGMTLQNVLTETKVTRRFRDMDINVMRVTPHSKGAAVPLQAEYDSARNRVGVLHDMTLYPGDHIMIVENTKSPLEEALGGFMNQRR